MPAIYTHYYFAQEVLTTLPEQIQEIIHKYPYEYYLGTQGPDFFFYDRPFKHNNLSKYGSEYHRLPGYTFFLKAKKELSFYQDKEPLVAYIYGFLSHYVLDSLMHSYIVNSELSHIAIEAEYDSHILRNNGINPASYNRSIIIRPTALTADFISRVFDLDLKRVKEMLRNFRWLAFGIDLPEALVHFIMKKLGVVSSFGQLTLNKEPDPQYCDCNSALDKIYQRAKDLYPTMSAKLSQYLQGNAELDQDFHYNYENRI